MLNAILEPSILAFVLVLTRVTAFLTVFPLLRLARIPNVVKVAFSLALTVHWLPATANSSADLQMYSRLGWLAYGLVIAREAFVGSALGYMLGLFFLPARIAGGYISQEMGFTLAAMADPTIESASDVMGDLLNALAVIIFLGGNLHYLAFGTLYRSFAYLPVGTGKPLFEMSTFSMGIAEAHTLGLQACGPIAVCLFLATVVIAIQMKMSPQMNLFTAGTALRIATGLCATFVFLPEVMSTLQLIFLQMQSFVLHLGFR